MKMEFVLDRRDGSVADTSGYYAKFCAGDVVKFMRPSNLTQLPMVRHCCDVKLCARGALKWRWVPQGRDIHKGY